MTQHRSISQRFSRAKSLETKTTVVRDWASNWQDEQKDIIEGIRTSTYNPEKRDELMRQLDAMTEKRFEALKKLLIECLEYRDDR